MGPLGGARSQYDLRKILGGLDAIVMPKPEVFIGMAQNRFDANGTLTDEATRKMLTDQMTALQAWIARVSS
jgi:chromate reductase